MAAGYDGSIRIDTKINTDGFNAGTKKISGGLAGISSSLKGLAIAAGLAYVTAQMIGLGKASIKAATEFENAMIGVRSIVDGQGRSFSQAKKFIQDYISDGLVPATYAANAYKNLAMRGYDDKQIEQTMIALKNSAAFGRQASLSMGEAIQRATEGLKNENSILVDNAGVTKNVSMMWKDYAKSIGVGVDSLTKQQRIQAEVLGIMEETRFQMGDAAKVAGLYSGQVMQLSFNFNNLKIAVGNALIPIAQAVLPSINAILVALTRLANLFAQVTAAIFGKQVDAQKKVTTSGVAAQKSQNGLAKATKGVGDASKKTNKELKNSLASFDELNILAKSTAESMEDAAGAGGVEVPEVTAGVSTEDIAVPGSPMLGQMQQDIERLRASLVGIGAYFADKFAGPITDALMELIPQFLAWKETLKGVFSDIGSLWEPFKAYITGSLIPAFQEAIPKIAHVFAGMLESANLAFQGIWEAAFPILEWFVTDGLKLVTDFSLGVLDIFVAMFDYVKTVFDKIWSEAIEPGLKLASKMIVDALNIVKDFWYKWGVQIVDGVVEAFKNVTQLFKDFWDKFLGPIVKNGLEMLSWLWDKHLKNLVFQVGEFVGKLITAALDIYNKFILPLISAIVDKFGPAFSTGISFVIDVIGTFLAVVIDIAAGILVSLGGVIDFITGVFTGDWKRAWEGVKSIFKGIFDGVTAIFKGAINLIIDAMNFMIRKLNNVSVNVPDWVSKISGMPKGSKFGFSIPTIPKLATGAVIPPNGEFLAVLGDQRNGRNLEAPEDLIRQIVREEGGNNGMLSVLQDIRAAIREGKVLVVDKQVLGKVVNKAQSEAFRTAGTTLVPV